LFVPALPARPELGLPEPLPLTPGTVVLLRPAIAQPGELAPGRLLVRLEAGVHPRLLLGAHVLETLPAGLVGFGLLPLVLGLPLPAQLPSGILPPLLRFVLGPLELDLEALSPRLRDPPRALLGLALWTSGVELSALPRKMGFLLRARLRFSHGALAVRIESCSPRHGILLGALHAVLLGPLELGFPTLEAALGLTLDPRSCLAQRVVELPAPPGPTLLGLPHGALALGLPARLTLVGFGGSAPVHLGLGAAVFGFPARATLLGFAQRTRVRVALGALVLGQPAGTPFLGLARQSLVLGLPARPTLARL